MGQKSILNCHPVFQKVNCAEAGLDPPGGDPAGQIVAVGPINLLPHSIRVRRRSLTRSLTHPLADWDAESEQPLRVRGHDEVGLAAVQRRDDGVPASLPVLNLRKEKKTQGSEKRPRSRSSRVNSRRAVSGSLVLELLSPNSKHVAEDQRPHLEQLRGKSGLYRDLLPTF